MHINSHLKLFLVILIVFLLTFNIAYLTPMQSDDFSYYLKGLSIQAHFDHYMGWSGRVVADYLSSGILSLKNHTVIAFINAWVLPLTIYNIATIPSFRQEKEESGHQNNLWLIYLILFVTYWLANPALGQTTFWVVGSANYLWPLLFISTYIKYGLRFTYQNTSVKLWQYIVCCLLALLSGGSNELASVVIVALTTLFLCFAFWKKHPNKYLVLVCFIFILIGSAILILAPGNMVRAAHPGFNEWKSLSIRFRLLMHIFETVPLTLISYGIFYLVFAWFFLDQNKNISRENKASILIFIGATLIFLVALIASPSVGPNSPQRVRLAGLFFLLIALSFLLNRYQTHRFTAKNYVFLTAMCLLFSVSYALMSQSYQSISEQAAIRNNIILDQKKQGIEQITIPDYFAPNFLRRGDAADWHYHSQAMAAYYGIKQINLIPVFFNYEKVMTQNCLQPEANTKFKQSQPFKCLYIVQNKLDQTTTYIFEFTPEVTQYLDDTHRFFIDIHDAGTLSAPKPSRIDIPLKVVQINNHYYSYTDTTIKDIDTSRSVYMATGIYQDTQKKDYIYIDTLNVL